MTGTAILLAAGRGRRMNAGRNKIFLPLLGVPLLEHALRAFLEVPAIDEFVVVLAREDMDEGRRVVKAVVPECRFAEGGEARRDSSLAGIRAATRDLVLIHDAARPFPSLELIHAVLSATQEVGAAVPTLAIADLLHRVDADTGRIKEASVADTGDMARAQTPQGFRRDLILHCLQTSSCDLRDDATAVHRAGHPVATVSGDPANLKVTCPADMILAAHIAASLR